MTYRVEKIGMGEFWVGDCLELMRDIPDGSVDMVVTSPPYNLNKKASGGGNSKRNYEGWYPDDMPEKLYQEWQVKVVSELLRITKGSIFYNHRIRYAWHSRNAYRHPNNIYHPLHWLGSFPIWSEIIWARGGTTGHANGRFRLSDERIFQIKKPHVFNDLGLTTVWSINPSKNEGHVCTFPEELVSRCILSCSNEGEVIIDPFAGSGTTAIAAERCGRRWICIERDEGYARKAISRIREEVACKQDAMF